ncbi:MAG: glycosyltransferase [Deferribacterales bacterium]|nr:glycosyltransferase [Deferribacterales bacterium]
MNKEQSFVSAVVCVEDNISNTVSFLDSLNNCLNKHFQHYEIIAVNRSKDESSRDALHKWAKNVEATCTVINMQLNQPYEQCMNAGLDYAIGDYVFEFDYGESCFDIELIWQAYQLAIKNGSDIVAVCPTEESGTSRLFYKLFNMYSNTPCKLRTEAFRLVSRRAVNRVHTINENMPYRKAAYSVCGLQSDTIEFEGKAVSKKRDRFGLAVDSLALYTDFGYKFSFLLSVFMVVATFLELVYTVTVWCLGDPISGWTTIMFVLTFGLTGLFAILTIVLKYLSLILKLMFRKQPYLINSIEKY